MIITFCGHSNILEKEKVITEIMQVLEKEFNYNPLTFYLGDYGDFDNIAKFCAIKYKEKSKESKIIFITPYIDKNYLDLRNPLKNGYDEIIYPGLEKVPKKYAILKRNEWIIKNSDFIIGYVNYSWGGASKALNYAIKNNKKIINLYKK